MQPGHERLTNVFASTPKPKEPLHDACLLSNLTTSAGRPGLYARCGTHTDCGLVIGRGCPHALLNLPCHGQESLLHIGSILGGGLKEGNTKAVGEFLIPLH